MYSATKFLLAVTLASLPAWANAQKLARPTGPITVTAKNAEWQEGRMIYSGDVLMVSSTMELRGERLEMRQLGGAKGPYDITVTGSPASFKQDGETAADPAVNAHAQKIVYHSATQDADLTQAAQLTRGKDEINGDSIRYNVGQRRAQASGGDKGQVKIVIDVTESEAPPRSDSKLPPRAPSSAAPTAMPADGVPTRKPLEALPKATATGDQP